MKYAKILRYQEKSHDLLLCAGVGWDSGVIGMIRFAPSSDSPAGHAFKTEVPVVCNDLLVEQRFFCPDVLKVHGVQSAINVIIRATGGCWGVLEADSREKNSFDQDDA